MSESDSHSAMAMTVLLVSSIATTDPWFPEADEIAGETVSLNNLVASSFFPGSIWAILNLARIFALYFLGSNQRFIGFDFDTVNGDLWPRCGQRF